MNAVVNTYKASQTLLHHALNVIESRSNGNLPIATSLKLTISRLGTFYLLTEMKVFDDIHFGTTGIKWQEFRKMKSLEVIQNFLRKDKVDAAIIFWERHADGFIFFSFLFFIYILVCFILFYFILFYFILFYFIFYLG